MPVHIFQVNEENFEVCIKKGVAGVIKKESDSTNDALISRMSIIEKGDIILFYVTGRKELHGTYKVINYPFYDEEKIWDDEDDNKKYAFRVRFDITEYKFKFPIKLNDIYDLKDMGLIWTFNLRSARGTNVVFSITDKEYHILLNLFLKINRDYLNPTPIPYPYMNIDNSLFNLLHIDEKGNSKFEYTVMALMIRNLANKSFKKHFGEYSDYISYVPTSFNKEMDIFLTYNNPINNDETIAYSVIEVKNDCFRKEHLKQLLEYEDWCLKKKAIGDSNMITSIAVAKSYSKDVIDYASRRYYFEGKMTYLYKYSMKGGNFDISLIDITTD